jgi:anti-anti-sigma regulatory factor
MNALWLNVDGDGVVLALEAAAEKLDRAGGEVIVDFSSVRRIDLSELRAIERFVGLAADKAVNIVLHGVNVDVYKVLKLVKLESRFSFAACDRDRGATELENVHAQASPK